MCIEYNECHYGGMYNVHLKRNIFVMYNVLLEKTPKGERRTHPRSKTKKTISSKTPKKDSAQKVQTEY